jgi:hypothetical protein
MTETAWGGEIYFSSWFQKALSIRVSGGRQNTASQSMVAGTSVVEAAHVSLDQGTEGETFARSSASSSAGDLPLLTSPIS